MNTVNLPPSLLAAITGKQSPLPVVKFDKEGIISNYEELMAGVPFTQTDEGRWKRTTNVWVDPLTPVCMNASRYYGVMELREMLTDSKDGGESYLMYYLQLTKRSKPIIGNANLGYIMDHTAILETAKATT